MLEKKTTSLKNIIFVKGFICISLILCSIWLITFLKSDYADSILKLDGIRPLIVETRIKLHEITDSSSNIEEGIAKHKEIYNKTEEMRCKEYQDILDKIIALKGKYNLPSPINLVMSNKPTKFNTSHNKQSYISIYDLKIEFSANDTSEAYEIQQDILALLPEHSLVYLMDINEISPITSKNTNLSLIQCKLYVKIREIVFVKS